MRVFKHILGRIWRKRIEHIVMKKRSQVFDDMWSILHFILGMIAAKFFVTFGWLLTIIFVLYEVEWEYYICPWCAEYDNAVGDIVEFIFGALIYLVLHGHGVI